MNILNFYENRINEIVNTCKGKKSTIFFMGFNKQFINILIKHDNFLQKELLGNLNSFEETLKCIECNKKPLIGSVVYADNLLNIGIYEQYILISDTINDKNMYDGEIYIIKNNLFNNNYPSNLQNETLKLLNNYFQNENVKLDSDNNFYINFYGCVAQLGNEYGVTYINKHTDEKVKVINFFNEETVFEKNQDKNYDKLSFSDSKYEQYTLDIMSNQLIVPKTIVVDSNKGELNPKLKSLIYLLKNLGISYSIELYDRFSDINFENTDKHLSLLKRYWGSEANFRKLKFYKNPAYTSETVSISQGDIISQIIDQGCCAISGSIEFKNIFITAPTGAGKSLLFQLPAIYFAEKYDAITIVVTPLVALMQDQVIQLEENHKVKCATFLNSSITFDEKEKRIADIKTGKKSIVYLAPETLLSSSIENIIGDRKIGLVVIDEAHIVTTWGKDFRSDYWFLGDYIMKLKKLGRLFPMLCLTATAVYGGTEDVVAETIETLSLDNPIVYLGNVRRKNIEFCITQTDKKDIKGSIEEYKIDDTVKKIKYAIQKHIKSIFYCPYISQVKDIGNEVRTDNVLTYYSKLESHVKNANQEKFKHDEYPVLIASKAFGMGLDISNIENVYHYAPTGSLSDYVQEIGRAARNENIKGHAITNFVSTDMKYCKTLYGLSKMKQYQLKEMLKKLYSIYQEKNSRNILISPDAFGYLFPENTIDDRVKNGLLLISKDLQNTYGIPIINVRPRNTFTKNFINVPEEIEHAFLHEYGAYSNYLVDQTKRIQKVVSNYASDVTITNSGHIYEVDMSKIWENKFTNFTFPQFKKMFFDGSLFDFGKEYKLSPRAYIKVKYKYAFDEVVEKMDLYIEKISNVFRKYKTEKRRFTSDNFRTDLKQTFETPINEYDISKLLLDMFVMDVSENLTFNQNSDKYRFISSKKMFSDSDMSYQVMNSNYTTLKITFNQLLAQCLPDEDGNYNAFIAIATNGQKSDKMKLLYVLELLNLASYEVIGGKNIEIFVRINDPVKLKRLSSEHYTNKVLSAIEKKHNASQLIMSSFLSHDFSSEKRWDIIENYFLGKEEYVKSLLLL